MGRRPQNPLQALADAARDQLRRARALGRSLDERIKVKQAASPEFTMDEDARRDFAAITTTLQHAGNSLIRALEGNKKDLGALSEDQLEAQFRDEIVRAAQAMSDEDWQRMCAARAKAGK